MAIYRNARPDEIGVLVALADRVFRKPEQTSMGAAYSLLFSEENASRILVAEEDGLPVSMVGLIRNDIKVADCKLSVVSMGAVCTDPLFRGKSFAGTLVEMAVRQCEEEGIHLLLVSGNRRLYSRNDCIEVGSVRTFAINPSDLDGKLYEGKSTQAMTSSYKENRDLEAMLKLMETETAYYNRTQEQFKQLIQNAAILSNDSKRQKVVVGRTNVSLEAYVVFGLWENNGEQIAEVIEFAGDDQSVLKVLHDIFMLYGVNRLKISAGIERQSLAGTLASTGCVFRTEPISGTVRMISFMKLWEALRPYIEERIGSDANKLTCTQLSNGYRMDYRGEEWILDAPGAALLTFNGPSMEGGDLKNVLSRLFPLPFVYTKNLNFT